PGNGWRQLPPYPGNKRWLPAVETDGKSIWMFGGSFQAEQKDPATQFSEVLRYDIEQAKWFKMNPLPEALVRAAPLSPFVVKGRIVLVGTNGGVWQLDLKTLEYAKLNSLPEAAA